MPSIKNLFGFRKNKGLDKSIIQKNPYRNNIDLNKRQFIKKGLLGVAGIGGLALASKMAKAGGLIFNDGSTQNAGAGGKVLQVVSAVYASETTGSSTSYADTGITANITPSSSSNKVLVICNIAGVGKRSSDNNLHLQLLRDSTTISESKNIARTGDTVDSEVGNSSMNELDSPSTTSSTTYKVQFKAAVASAEVRYCSNNSEASIVLMEIEST